jgi:hypothetical protein
MKDIGFSCLGPHNAKILVSAEILGVFACRTIKKVELIHVSVIHTLAIQEARWWFKASPGQIDFKTLSRKSPTQNRVGGVTQVVEHLSSKCKALSSNPRTTN